MSGHSKWANIRVKKTAQDAKRGKVFTRHAKLIEIAAREGGGGDPDMNPRLATAIENAKIDNVPNVNIERAIKKGSGELKGEQTEAVIYEAYLPLHSSKGAEGGGPSGAACIIECLTDNRNRTLSSVRAMIEKRDGKWAASGAVMFLFDRKGVVTAKGRLSEETELKLIDAGAEDIEESGDIVSVTTEADKWAHVRDTLKEAGLDVQEAGLKYVAKQHVSIDDVGSARKLMEFIEEIEEDEDVSEVHTNADITDAVMAQLK